jgi:hypothetical protein
MAPSLGKTEVYLEVGAKRVFAGALDWPGWCRSGKEEESALQALAEYGPRYAKLLRRTKLGFEPPPDASALKVVERLPGDASTDFGAPGKAPAIDEHPIDAAEVKRMTALMKACWSAFDRAVRSGAGKELRKGPRGGGRDLDKIVQHVIESEGSYLALIGQRYTFDPKADPKNELARLRTLITKALSESAGAGPVSAGPRGGKRWTPRYFVRRSAWHVLDHAWEIEDRTMGPARP